MSDSATWLEVTWTLIAVGSIGFTAWIVDDNVRNFLAIKKAVQQGRAIPWGPRYWVAVASLVSSAAMFVVWVGFAFIGIVSMNVSPNDPEGYRADVQTASGWTLIAMTLLLAGIQGWQVFARTKIRPLTSPAGAINEAEDQKQLAANMVDALRPDEDRSA
jgi:hypothetical protein